MRFYSRGKLLISGEYLVLKGATALTVPLVKGQDLQVSRSENADTLTWESRELGKTWFTGTFRKPFFEITESSDEPTAVNLARHFRAMAELEPKVHDNIFGAHVTTSLEFNRQWGFGSSSTLISNLAGWAGIDPFALHRKLSRGSGYDVVCAREEGPFFFSLNRKAYKAEPVDLQKKISRYLYFVYLGKKAESAQHVADFLTGKKGYRVEKRMVSELSRHMAAAGSIDDFGYYMKEHELVISSILRKPALKEGIFQDMPGEAKSLGAWGGDFAMITWTRSRKALEEYLKTKDLTTYFSFNELVKTR